MRTEEYKPLHPNGFKDISEADMYAEFVQPFNNGREHRINLLINFGQFLNEVKELGLEAEVWIDGSFVTYAPDPSDVDAVFYFDGEKVNTLRDDKKELFDKLFQSRKMIKNLYKVEAFYAQRNDEREIREWSKVFGTYYDNKTPKGIFRLYLN